jgi:predicted RNA binding protein YcfA (HicA-like mRNA interferase family)
MVKLKEGFSFRLARISGSHHIFNCPDLPELVNIQNRKGKVVPYQVNQFLSLVEKYDLRLED